MQKAGCKARASEDRGRRESKGNARLYSNMEENNAKTNISCTHESIFAALSNIQKDVNNF